MARKSLKELNTACVATFKDGHTEEYSSIEEASEKTGLSVAAIKIRCNKKGTGGKDKTYFEWVDEYTKRHYLAKRSKHKGADWEIEIVKNLREIGYETACRAAGESKKLDNQKVDIAGDVPFAIQAKNTMVLPNYFTLRDACPDPRQFVLMWKKASEGGAASPGSVAILPTDLFYELLTLYHEKHG